MTNLQDIINLATEDGGKFFILGPDGDVKMVMLPVSEYRRLASRKTAKADEVDLVNEQISRIKQHEVPAPEPSARITSPDLRAEVIDPSFDFEGPKIDLEEI